MRRLTAAVLAAAVLAACGTGEEDPRHALCDYFYGETLTTYFEMDRHGEMSAHATRLRELSAQVQDPALAQAGFDTADITDAVVANPAEWQRFLGAPLDFECESFSGRYRS